MSIPSHLGTVSVKCIVYVGLLVSLVVYTHTHTHTRTHTHTHTHRHTQTHTHTVTHACTNTAHLHFHIQYVVPQLDGKMGETGVRKSLSYDQYVFSLVGPTP